MGALLLMALPFTACSSDTAVAPVQPAPATSQPARAPSGAVEEMATTPPSEPAALPWVDIAAARRELGQLPVKGRAPMTGYTREAFGTAWSDVNDNGCDTRNDVLRRDLTDKQVADCVVLSGVLRDPYSGQRVEFTRGPVTSLDVQIDHVVALANAWATGAQYFSDARREQFANDRRSLLAVRGDLNLQKSDGDAATWLPPKKDFRCTYVSLQIQTKARYQLWVTPPEKAAMQRILAGC